MPRERLSAPEARRLALASQGFAEPRPDGEPGGWDLRRVLKRVGLLQIDSVNVLERAHYLPAFSRLGPYSHEALDRLSQRAPRRLFEYWGHEASLIPVELPAAAALADGARRTRRLGRDANGSRRERPELVAEVLEQVRDRGPIAASELTAERPRRSGPWWDWSDSKRALEWLFWSGQVTAARRRRFERLYDLPERVLPAKVLAAPTPAPDEAQRELLRIAAALARGRGRARPARLLPPQRPPSRSRGSPSWSRPATWSRSRSRAGARTRGYLRPGARIPRRVEATALIGPFDSLIWERSRVERIFGFAFRLEIYVPAPKRRYGYYVLPFLLGDRLVARVDLKADRDAGAPALATRCTSSPARRPRPNEALEAELRRIAGWLGHEFDRLP